MYLPFNAIYAKAAAGCQLMVLKFTRCKIIPVVIITCTSTTQPLQPQQLKYQHIRNIDLSQDET
jgi:hypothetical protein